MDDIPAALTPVDGGEAATQAAYADYANPDLLERMPLTARTLLDVGCARGALGAAYLRRNPKARYLGIDTDAQALEVAQGRLSEVACVDAEDLELPFEAPGGFDCIAYGDVLEHLRDPWAVLARHAQLLAPGGTVVVCMPNAEHWTIALRLLNGTFNYEDKGLLDRTHLRWFTPRTMADALTRAGLQLSDLAPRSTSMEQVQKFATAMAPGLAAIGVDANEYVNRAGPIQFIWRARKIAPARMVVNATMLAPLGGVSDVRVIEPIRALRTDSAVLATIVAEPEMTPPLPGTPKIAILHRPLLMGESGVARLKALLGKGYLVISEFDDHPIFIEQRGLPVDQMLTFRGVHAVQTSTPVLADVLAEQNPEVGMFPNGVFELPEVRNFEDPDQLTLFFGALNRGEDWAPLMQGMNEIARAVGSRLKFAVAHDRAFFDALETPHKQFHATCDYQTYMNLMGQAEIVFMPLADTVFNRAKSDLKFIEAASCRAVSLASAVVYGNSIQDGRTGLLFRDAAEMRSHLLRILAYPEAAKRQGDAARDYVARQRMLAYQVADRTEWYRSLWERYDELNAGLRARVPALFD